MSYKDLIDGRVYNLWTSPRACWFYTGCSLFTLDI